MTTSKKDATAAGKILKSNRKTTAAKALAQAPAKRGAKKTPVKRSRVPYGLGPAVKVTSSTTKPPGPIKPHGGAQVSDERPRPESVDEETIARLIAEAEGGIPAEKLRRRGRPAIGDEAASTYSVRLPDDLVTLADERSAIDCVTRGETIRRALIEYLTK
jgi:hypothetical protein